MDGLEIGTVEVAGGPRVRQARLLAWIRLARVYQQVDRATGNASLYDDAGIAAARHALTPGGTLAVWSAWEDRKFEQRLRYGGFHVRVERVRARLKKGGPRHTIFLGRPSIS